MKQNFILLLIILCSSTIFAQTWAQLDKEGQELSDKAEYEKATLILQQGIDVARKEFGLNQPQHATSLDRLGELYIKMGKYKEAERLLTQAKEIRKIAPGDSSADYAASLNDLGELYVNMGQNEKAEALLLAAVEIRKKVLGENHPDYATSLDNLGLVYVQMSKYEKAEPLFLQVKEIREKALGVNHPDFATSLCNLGFLYVQVGQFAKGDSLYIQARDIRKKVLGENHPDYATSLDNLGLLYNEVGEYAKAEPLYEQALEIRKRTLGEDHPAYGNSLTNLAEIYRRMSKFEKAEPLLIQAKEIQKRASGENSPDYAVGLGNLAALYIAMGQYENALPLSVKSTEILKKALGEDHPAYAGALNNLAYLYDRMGQYGNAVPLYLKTIEIVKKLLGEEHPYYTATLANLGILYLEIGQYDKAVSLFVKVKEIQERLHRDNQADYAANLNTLALVYVQQGLYQQAVPLCLKAKEIDKQVYGEENPGYATSLASLSWLYTAVGQLDKAASLDTQVIAIRKKALGEVHPDYGASLSDLSFIYRNQERYAEAEPLLIQGNEIEKKAMGEDYSGYANGLYNLAILYEVWGRYEKAEPLIVAADQIMVKQVKTEFTILSEKEKGDYLKNQLSAVEVSNGFLYMFKKASPAYIRNNLNLELFLKSLSLLETRNMLESIRNSPDSSIQRLFARWVGTKELLAKQYSSPQKKATPLFDSVAASAEADEESLTRTSAEFRRHQNSINISMADVQKNLREGEVAIEFVNFKLLYKKWTDSVIYAAYILHKHDSVPAFVPLCEEKQLSRLFDSAGNTATTMVNNLYRGAKIVSVKPSYLGDSLYKLIWQPLEPYLQGVKKIAYAPAGKLYSIAFCALPVDKRTLLLDKYDLQQYTSIREIALRTSATQAIKPGSITLFGDPRFTMDSSALVHQRNRQSETGVASTNRYVPPIRGNHDGVWADLPGTAEEVKKIGDLFRKNKLETTIFTQANASEGNLKALSGHSPQVLHIATHGFFLPEPEKKNKETAIGEGDTYTLADDPLLRSGLILSGGNHAWSGKAPIEGIDDGIATAYEISQLNLRNTELVVLSACETALGDVKSTEGVFGLQRAFKIAGAKKMIVSLWQVPDKETAELMTTFYSYWMNGKTIEESFTMAQAKMRKKYPPYYWAAFVLVD